jgi:acid phosphatase
MVVVFENEDAQKIVGAPDAPYLTSLARAGASFTDAHGVAHPSQPNYLALFSGSTHGVTDDSCPQTFTGPNLAAGLATAGRTFVGYSEDLPSEGFTGCGAGRYAAAGRLRRAAHRVLRGAEPVQRHARLRGGGR